MIKCNAKLGVFTGGYKQKIVCGATEADVSGGKIGREAHGLKAILKHHARC